MTGLDGSSCHGVGGFTGWRVVTDGVLHPKVLADSLVNLLKAKGVSEDYYYLGYAELKVWYIY